MDFFLGCSAWRGYRRADFPAQSWAVEADAIGLFNIARVSVHGSRVEHWLNGAPVLAFDLASEVFRRRPPPEWLNAASQSALTWTSHRDINGVTLAAGLAPDGAPG